MTKKGKAQSKSSRSLKERHYLMTGRAPFYTTLSSGVFSLAANGLLTTDSRLAGISDQFQLYRFKKLRFTMHEGSWGSSLLAGKYSTGYAAGLYLEIPDTLPSTDHVKLLREPYSVFMDGSWAAAGGSAPTGYQGPLQAGYSPRKLMVPPSHLLGGAPYKWWRTRAGTSSDVWELCQWLFYVVAEDTTLGSGLQFTWYLDYEIEFSDPVDPAQTPLAAPSWLSLITAAEVEEIKARAQGKTPTGDPLVLQTRTGTLRVGPVPARMPTLAAKPAPALSEPTWADQMDPS